MIVWFSFTLCGIIFAICFPGIWGMVECIQEKKDPKENTLCAKRTTEKLTFSVLTLTLSAVLLMITTVINCLFCCNKKAFGFKTIRYKRYEFNRDMVSGTTISEETVQQRTNERTDRTRGQGGYDDNRTNIPQENTRGRQGNFAENVREYSREQSAPPLESDAVYNYNYRAREDRHPPGRFQQGKRTEGTYLPRRSPDDDDHHRRPGDDRRNPHYIPQNDQYQTSRFDDERNRPRVSNEDRHRPGGSHADSDRQIHNISNTCGDEGRNTHGQIYVNQGGDNEIGRNLENDSEAPPPSYDDVVNKYLMYFVYTVCTMGHVFVLLNRIDCLSNLGNLTQ